MPCGADHTIGAAADAKATALAQFGAVAGNGSAAHGKFDIVAVEARVNAAACQAGIVAGDIAAGHGHSGAVRQGDTAAAVGVVDIVLAVVAAACLIVVGHIALAGQIQRSAVDVDTAAVVMATVDPVARHRTAGDVQRSVLKEDTAAGTATVGRNNTALDIHRSVGDVNTAAGRAVTAAAHNIAAGHGQRSALHQDYPFAAAVPKRTAPDVQCTSVDLNRLVRGFIAPDCAGEGDGMLFQRFRRAGTIGRGFCDVICQGIICQCRLIAVKAAAARGHSLLRGCRVYNGKRRAGLHFKKLMGLADCQGMPVQIDGSVLRNAHIRAIIPISRPGIAGQPKFAAAAERVPDIAGQLPEGLTLH